MVIVGLGYVGLPLAVAFAESGLRVVGVDIDGGRVDALNAAHSYVEGLTDEQLAPLVTGDAPLLTATTGYDALATADVAIICVPTPLSKTRTPDMSYIVNAAECIAEHLHPGMLVVLESTTYPGATEEVVLERLRSACRDHMTVGEDFFLAFSPERIDPGRSDWTIRNTPKVIGGVTPRCTDMAHALYSTAIEQVVRASSPVVAEMAKLLENTYRAVNIAMVNELAIMCGRLDVDVWEVIEVAKTKPFGFAAFYPGPGLGGHCLPSDPEYLAWKMRSLNYDARFVHLAAEINLGMPEYVSHKVSDALNSQGKPLRGSQVLVLGVAYKENVSDVRDAPALDLIPLLREKGAEVSYHDPHVPSFDLDGESMTRVTLDSGRLQAADCVVIVTAHASYDWQWVVDNSQLVVDTRNATRDTSPPAGRVLKL